MEPGTSAFVTNPSANRVHVADSDGAEVHQQFEVCEGAWLDYAPAILIPQAGSRYRQSTRVEFEKGGAGFFLESMAPGRVARGELFEFESLEWETDVCYAGKLILKERYSLNHRNGSLAGFQKPISNAFFAGGFIVSDDLQNYRSIAEDLREISGKDILIGLSAVEPFLWSLKILSANSILLKRCLKSVRKILSSVLPRIAEQTRMPL
jgi:urease accessory protein